MVFEWKDNYSVSIEEIDLQHKKLFEIGQKVYDAIADMGNSDRYDDIVAITDELNEYVEYHFDYEEKLMEKIGYDKLEIHKIEHRFFVKKLHKIKDGDIESFQKGTLLKLIDFVASWIVNHILIEDMAYKKCFDKIEIK
ncbi:MAG: hemerythrin family protein [Bacillota bacterium]|nr:hemerythrin family protein [Bacillota bacterium]